MENLIRSLRDRGLLQSDQLEQAIRETDIRNFLAPELREISYYSFLSDRPALAINENNVQRTISAPHMICIIFEKIIPNPNEKYLILGSKFGYFATLIYKMDNTAHVTILEANSLIFNQTRDNLRAINLNQHISVKKKNPLQGLPSLAPFHKILITGSIEEIPQTLFNQLADGGILIAPVGEFTQDLLMYEKTGNQLEETNLCSVVFSRLETFVESETGTDT
jgi:protein-L-isoaspartate(D-aspartate) O-methyltransferase